MNSAFGYTFVYPSIHSPHDNEGHPGLSVPGSNAPCEIDFLEACRAQDKAAAQVWREFMRVFIERQGVGAPAHASVAAGTHRKKRR
jgi:hypothetical protein